MLKTIKNLVESHPRRTVLILLFILGLLMQATVGLAPPDDTGPWRLVQP